MKCNSAGINLITQFEGCRLQAYQDQRGIWTIGYGHTGNVGMGEVITEEQAEELLRNDLAHVEEAITWSLRINLSSNGFSALCSLAYNIGCHALTGSTLMSLLNNGRMAEAADQFLAWDHCNGVVDAGLLRRRRAEQALFLSPDGA